MFCEVNKLVVAKKRYDSPSFAVYGNHAYKLDRYEYDYRKNKEEVNRSLKVNHIKKVKKRLKLVAAVTTMFLTCVLIIGRYAMIMNLNNQSREVKKSIAQSQKVNEDLKLQLMKYNDITQLEKTASSSFNMVHPGSANTIHIAAVVARNDISKADGQQKNVSILTKVLEFFN
jgi:Septum formation initiator.